MRRKCTVRRISAVSERLAVQKNPIATVFGTLTRSFYCMKPDFTESPTSSPVRHSSSRPFFSPGFLLPTPYSTPDLRATDFQKTHHPRLFGPIVNLSWLSRPRFVASNALRRGRNVGGENNKLTQLKTYNNYSIIDRRSGYTLSSLHIAALLTPQRDFPGAFCICHHADQYMRYEKTVPPNQRTTSSGPCFPEDEGSPAGCRQHR